MSLTGALALASGGTAPTPTAGDNSTKLATTAFVHDAISALALGVGQTWQDVKSARAFGTAYQNTTGRPIQVIVSAGEYHDGELTALVSTNGTDWITLGTSAAEWTDGAQRAQFCISIVVPNGNYYKFEASGGGGNGGASSTWCELR